MNSRSIKALSLCFFIFLLSGLLLGGYVLRIKHVDQANQVFQSIIPDAQQFIMTYRTIDPGLRQKTSETIFSKVKNENTVQSIYILDQENHPVLAWQRSASQLSVIPPAAIIPSADLRTSIFESSLPGSSHVVMVNAVLGYDELAALLIIALSALVLFAIFLITLLFMKNDNPVVDQAQGSANEEAPNEEDKVDSTIETIPQPKSEEIVSQNDPDSRFLILDQKSGVTQEKFLNFRLDKELQRSAENAIDMSVALFKFQNLQASDHSIAAKLLLSEFSHEDLIFESGKDTFCVIMPQHDLDQGIARADLLIRKSTDKFATTNTSMELTAGLSSRNGRLLDSPRFIHEAQVALKKANSREGRIVGFRPDPVRFRNFLRYHRV